MGQTVSDSIPLQLKPDTTIVKSESIGEFMKEWLGVRYRLGGSTKRGIDCSQFTKRFYKDIYGRQLQNVAYKQWNQTKRIRKPELIVGDIVFFRSKSSPSGWHCGIYIGNDRFLHASNRHEGVKISELSEPKYVKSYRGAGRL
jgi:cell wall-associated NlpC family hydrolase